MKNSVIQEKAAQYADVHENVVESAYIAGYTEGYADGLAINKVPSDDVIRMILELSTCEMTTEELIEIVKKELYQL